MRLAAYLSALLAISAGCDVFGPASSLSHAAARFWCGPADGPATAIVLAQEPVQPGDWPYPSVHVMIWQDVSRIAGHTWSVTSDAAGGSYTPTPDRLESPISGTITIRSVDAAKTVRGSLRLRFPSRSV